MKTLVLAVAVGLLVGCALTSQLPPDLKAFDAYCVNSHIRYQAWSSDGEVWITAWPESGKRGVPDGFTSDWRGHQAGYWVEHGATIRETADKVLDDIRESRPRILNPNLTTVQIGAR